MRVVADPGAHGAVVTGTQGCGVRTPRAAEVAAATWGLARELHMPKGGMLVIGTKSMIVAAGGPHTVLLAGRTLSAAGAAPKLHAIMAPEVTSLGMAIVFLFQRSRRSDPGRRFGRAIRFDELDGCRQ